jgi:uncharacterized phage protein (TIGR01671 family)
MVMREYKFRAQKVTTKEWVYGTFVIIRNVFDENDQEEKIMFFDNPYIHGSEIIYDIWIEVKRGTVGQYTGLRDKNGKEIYEGDIVKYHDHPTGMEDGVGSVYYKNGKWMAQWTMIPLGDFGKAWVEVIGNIFENKDLLK